MSLILTYVGKRWILSVVDKSVSFDYNLQFGIEDICIDAIVSRSLFHIKESSL